MKQALITLRWRGWTSEATTTAVAWVKIGSDLVRHGEGCAPGMLLWIKILKLILADKTVMPPSFQRSSITFTYSQHKKGTWGCCFWVQLGWKMQIEPMTSEQHPSQLQSNHPCCGVVFCETMCLAIGSLQQKDLWKGKQSLLFAKNRSSIVPCRFLRTCQRHKATERKCSVLPLVFHSNTQPQAYRISTVRLWPPKTISYYQSGRTRDLCSSSVKGIRSFHGCCTHARSATGSTSLSNPLHSKQSLGLETCLAK